MDLASIVLAPIRVPVRIAQALDDLAVLADRARNDPDPLAPFRERIDKLIDSVDAMVGVATELVGGGAELTATAEAIHEIAVKLTVVAQALDGTGQKIVLGGQDLTDTGKVLTVETAQVIRGGQELTSAAERIDADLRVFRAVLPRLLEVLPAVEHLEDAVETVAETIEPLQGAAERVGRVTNRLSRSRS